MDMQTLETILQKAFGVKRAFRDKPKYTREQYENEEVSYSDYLKGHFTASGYKAYLKLFYAVEALEELCEGEISTKDGWADLEDKLIISAY